MTPMPVVVMISGRGSNLHAILKAVQSHQLAAEVRMVISNKNHAEGLSISALYNIPTKVVPGPDRARFEHEVIKLIDHAAPRLVVLAGFMQVLSSAFVMHYQQRLINIHPSLLPAFPGLYTHRRAIEQGVREHGASVHLVTPEVDAGPLIAQVKIAVSPQDTEQTLADRVLIQEHILFPKCLQWFAENRISVRNGIAFLDEDPLPKIFPEFDA